MGLTNVIHHLLNFVLPALALAVALPILSRMLPWGRVDNPSWRLQCLLNFVASLSVLMGGVWFFDHDGKMATYMAMVVSCATSQWLMLRARRV